MVAAGLDGSVHRGRSVPTLPSTLSNLLDIIYLIGLQVVLQRISSLDSEQNHACHTPRRPVRASHRSTAFHPWASAQSC